MTPRAVAVLVVLLTASLAGCHAPGAGPDDETPATMRLAGWFNDWNETIAADFNATVSPYTDDVLILESFPPGFVAEGVDADRCDELRGLLMAKDYLREVGECTEPADTRNGDTPTSSGA